MRWRDPCAAGLSEGIEGVYFGWLDRDEPRSTAAHAHAKSSGRTYDSPRSQPMKPIRPLVQDQDMVVVQPATMVTQAARLMSERQIGAVPVVDGERLAGIFTERDVLSRIVAAGLDPATTTVGSVMSTNLIVADIEEGHEVCMRRM